MRNHQNLQTLLLSAIVVLLALNLRGQEARHSRWLVDADTFASLSSLVPLTEDSGVNQSLRSPDLMFYTDAEMPPAYQNWSRVSSGVHSPLYDISGGADKFGAGTAFEFPWKDSFGTHNVNRDDFYDFRAVRLPRVDGKLLPILHFETEHDTYWTKDYKVPKPAHQKIDWIFPHGTQFFEILVRKTEVGGIPVELRVRERVHGGWSVNVFRPQTSREELQESLSWWGLESLPEPQYRDIRLYDETHAAGPAIDVSAKLEVLEPFPGEVVKKLAWKQVFRSVLGQDWDDQSVAVSGGIYPRGYEPALTVDSVSCTNCHQDANQHKSLFQIRRDWYGNVRGSDQIISFHIFDESCISRRGKDLTIQFRKEFLDWGILKPAPEKIPANYSRIN